MRFQLATKEGFVQAFSSKFSPSFGCLKNTSASAKGAFAFISFRGGESPPTRGASVDKSELPGAEDLQLRFTFYRTVEPRKRTLDLPGACCRNQPQKSYLRRYTKPLISIYRANKERILSPSLLSDPGMNPQKSLLLPREPLNPDTPHSRHSTFPADSRTSRCP